MAVKTIVNTICKFSSNNETKTINLLKNLLDKPFFTILNINQVQVVERNMISKAMIMAAGMGSRLMPVTKDTPKPLVTVADKPLMDIIMQLLEKNGIKKVIANTHYLGGKIRERYTKHNPTSIEFHSIHENELSGTAGGVKKCEFFFEGEDEILIISGDCLTNIDLEKMYKKHKDSNAMFTMAVFEVPMEKVPHFGVIVRNEDESIKYFQEKPSVEEAKSNLINTGIYMFKKEIFNYIPVNTFYDFAKDVFPKIMADNIPIQTYKMEGYWHDIGTLEEYYKVNETYKNLETNS